MNCVLVLCLPEAADEDQNFPGETDLFSKYYNEWKGTGKVNSSKNCNGIPRFYFKVHCASTQYYCYYSVLYTILLIGFGGFISIVVISSSKFINFVHIYYYNGNFRLHCPTSHNYC